MRRLHLGCRLQDHDLEGADCPCDPYVTEVTDENGCTQLVVLHQDITN